MESDGRSMRQTGAAFLLDPVSPTRIKRRAFPADGRNPLTRSSSLLMAMASEPACRKMPSCHATRKDGPSRGVREGWMSATRAKVKLRTKSR